MLSFINLIHKAGRLTWGKLVHMTRGKSYYPKLYRSYWHLKLSKKKTKGNVKNFFTATPHSGAGIGHQLANWISGYWFANFFELNFAHTPFPNSKWEYFFGFGDDEVTVNELVNGNGFTIVRLPLFDESNPIEVSLIKEIIESYSCKRVVFLAEQDQSYRDQFGVVERLRQKFYKARAREDNCLIYYPKTYNIAVHIRRGDIVIGQENRNPNLTMRWQNYDYFKNILSMVTKVETNREVNIYLFSQGTKDDFVQFNEFNNIHFCLDMNEQDSFLHMVYADMLITSKSSFSYKPALLSRGVKICPRNFWHGYPNSKEWILAEDDGTFEEKLLEGLVIEDANDNFNKHL